MIKASLPYSADIFYDVMFQAKANLQNQLTIEEVFERAGLKLNERWFDGYSINKSEYLTNESSQELKKVIFEHINEVAANYSSNKIAAKEYLMRMVGEHKKSLYR